MIKYRLNCKNCKISFDSWFASSKDYDKLKRLKHIACHNCDSLNIEKSLMSPNVLNSNINKNSLINEEKNKKIKNEIKKYQRFIKNNFKYVGKNFSSETRLIHYGNKKNKNIYGKATIKEVKELKDEGIEIDTIPWVNIKEN